MKLKMTYNGADYYMEFDRATAEATEKELGVSVSDLTAMRITVFPSLFHGSLLKHHPNMKQKTVDMLFEKLAGKRELYAKLVEMYVETIQTLLDEPAEGEAVSWAEV